MNYTLIVITFIAVNLDFFFILLFLLDRYPTHDVIVGYTSGVILLLTISWLIGRALNDFLPEWVLGVLGVLLIYMAIHDSDESAQRSQGYHPIVATFVTYLAVCSGCNLSIFLPVLMDQRGSSFITTLILVVLLTILAVLLVKWLGTRSIVKQVMSKYGDRLMKVVYIGVGLYVFYDSGLFSHLLNLI